MEAVLKMWLRCIRDAVGMSLFPAVMVAAGLARVVGDVDLWRATAVIIGHVTLLSAASAVGSALWFRYSARDRTSSTDG